MPEPEEKKGTNVNQQIADLKGYIAKVERDFKDQIAHLSDKVELLLKHSKVPRSRG